MSNLGAEFDRMQAEKQDNPVVRQMRSKIGRLCREFEDEVRDIQDDFRELSSQLHSYRRGLVSTKSNSSERINVNRCYEMAREIAKDGAGLVQNSIKHSLNLSSPQSKNDLREDVEA